MKRLTIIALALGILLSSCHKRTQATVAVPEPLPPPPPEVVHVVVPVAAPVPVPLDVPASLPVPAGAALFEQAELAFAMSDYEAAIQDYENYLQSVPNGDRTDQVLFHVGMAYVLRTKPPANWTRATASLRRLVNEHPDSPLRPEATLILSLRSRADQLAKDAKATSDIVLELNMELERLKKIDADRRKRP